MRLAAAACRRRRAVINAGLIMDERVLTEDGLETTFAVNHIGYFCSHVSQPKLCAQAPARIVNVASRAHRSGTIRFDDLMGARGFDGWKAYTQSKLVNIVFTYELDPAGWPGPAICGVDCLPPGRLRLRATSANDAGPTSIRLGEASARRVHEGLGARGRDVDLSRPRHPRCRA